MEELSAGNCRAAQVLGRAERTLHKPGSAWHHIGLFTFNSLSLVDAIPCFSAEVLFALLSPLEIPPELEA